MVFMLFINSIKQNLKIVIYLKFQYKLIKISIND